MKLTEIVQETKDYQSLKDEISKGNIAKSILLLSKDSSYSFEFAKMLACEIFSGGKEDENFFKVQAGAHPDLKIYPTKDKLLVADSQEIVMESFIKPVFAEKKVFIIRNIENSIESAQNKLLKVLEEPPKNVYFILTSSSENLVLPTIKSRCNKIQLSKIRVDEIEKFFEGNENKEIICAISDGLIGKAEELSQKKNLSEIFVSVLSLFTKLKSSKEVLVYSSKVLANKEDLTFIFEIYSLLLEEILFIKTENRSLRFESCFDSLKEIENEFSLSAICEIQKLLCKAEKELFYSANQSLILENFLLNVLEVKYLCK